MEKYNISAPTFLLRWYIAGLLPLILVTILAWMLLRLTNGEFKASGPMLFVSFIASFAVTQALALRPYVDWHMRWLQFTLLGMILGMLATFPLLAILDPLGVNEIIAGAATHTLGGAALGVVQWFALRDRVHRAFWWIPLSACLWGVLATLWYPLYDLVYDLAWLPGRLPITFAGEGELGGLLRLTASAALVTGPNLLWMLRRPNRHGASRMSRGIPFKLCLVFISVVCATSSSILTGAGARQDQRPATTPAQPDDKPAEQVYKNIQVLRGMPASRLLLAMNRLTQSLGVDCAHCHVSDTLDKDDKPAKQTARKMFEMVRTINATLGANRVTCYTCHRGQPQPASMPRAPANTAPKSELSAPEIKPADPKANVDAILDQYIQALGGRAALERVMTRVKTGTLVAQGGMKAPLEVYEKAPNKTLTIFRAPHGTNQMGFDGAIGWAKTPERGLREEAGQQLDHIRSEAEFYKELKLRGRYSKLTLLGLAQLDNREAYVIEAAPLRGQPEKLYFDRQTGLLVRMDLVPNLGPEKTQAQVYFEDYRAVDGVKLPFAIRRARPGFTWTYQFDEIKLNTSLDDSRFNKPAAPQ